MPLDSENFPSAGTILAMRSNGDDVELVECVVQVTPSIIGIYLASELVRLEYAKPAEELEMLVP